MIRIVIKILCWINNFSYKAISSLAVRENDGIHPKHAILNYHQFFLDNISSEDHVLDIGCGNGSSAYDLSRKASHITAIDISERNIETAKNKFKSNNIDYITGDATKYNFKEDFDVIILSNVLEHIENRIDFLNDIKKLAPKILIRIPLITRDWLSVYKKEKGSSYLLDPTHFIEYTEEEFESEMHSAGLHIECYKIKFGEIYGIVKTDKK
jgi:2-polyprenyl-3-methyl-5-hydroxy-6-metoxy-1,4-benzoquinol methylase